MNRRRFITGLLASAAAVSVARVAPFVPAIPQEGLYVDFIKREGFHNGVPIDIEDFFFNATGKKLVFTDEGLLVYAGDIIKTKLPVYNRL